MRLIPLLASASTTSLTLAWRLISHKPTKPTSARGLKVLKIFRDSNSSNSNFSNNRKDRGSNRLPKSKDRRMQPRSVAKLKRLKTRGSCNNNSRKQQPQLSGPRKRPKSVRASRKKDADNRLKPSSYSVDSRRRQQKNKDS